MPQYCKVDFKCIRTGCEALIVFSISDIEENHTLKCGHCSKAYTFHPDFVDKIRKFSHLIEAVQDAKEILGDTHVAIDIKDDTIKIPYRLLLTRMNTLITLRMEDGEINFRFRVEPLNEKEIIK